MADQRVRLELMFPKSGIGFNMCLGDIEVPEDGSATMYIYFDYDKEKRIKDFLNALDNFTPLDQIPHDAKEEDL